MNTRSLAIGYRTPLATRLDLSLYPGVTALIGRNGAGKSTLIKTLTGNLRPLSGEVVLDGKSILHYSKKELAKKISLVSTDNQASGGLRLHELVALGRIPYTGRLGLLSSDDKNLVEAAMEKVGVGHKKDSFVAELSDGERQKGMIARGLVQDTPVIIMDEPFSFLDVASRLEMLVLIKNLARENDKAILFSTHEVTEALQMADRVWMFTTDGFAAGTPDELIEGGEVDKLFPNSGVIFDRKRRTFTIKTDSQKY